MHFLLKKTIDGIIIALLMSNLEDYMKLENHYHTLSLIDDTIAYIKSQEGNTRQLISNLVKYRYKFDSFYELLDFIKNEHPDHKEIWEDLTISYEN